MPEVVRITGITQIDLKPGYKFCPHCKGKTACNCGTCGISTTQQDVVTKYVENENRKSIYDPMTIKKIIPVTNQYFEFGICKVCYGAGQLPDPEGTANDERIAQEQAEYAKRQDNQQAFLIFVFFLMIIGLIVALYTVFAQNCS